MKTVSFKTNSAIFAFQIQDINVALSEHSCDQRNKDAKSLLLILSSSPGESIKIHPDNRHFQCIVLQLIENGQGQVNCLLCNKSYLANQLNKFCIGAGDGPFNVRIQPGGILKRLFCRKRLMPGKFGGKSFRCPAGHELISVVTWIS